MTKSSTLENVLLRTRTTKNSRNYNLIPSAEKVKMLMGYSMALEVLKSPSGKHYLILN